MALDPEKFITPTDHSSLNKRPWGGLARDPEFQGDQEPCGLVSLSWFQSGRAPPIGGPWHGPVAPLNSHNGGAVLFDPFSGAKSVAGD
jgi:hypothetical protein